MRSSFPLLFPPEDMMDGYLDDYYCGDELFNDDYLLSDSMLFEDDEYTDDGFLL